MSKDAFDIVVVRTWKELFDRPAHKVNMPVDFVKLGKVVGEYSMPTEEPCGLPSCHQKHRHGFVIRLTSNDETHLGRHCGRKHFGQEWSIAKSDFGKRRAAFDREVVLGELIAALPELKNRFEAIKLNGLSRATQFKNLLISERIFF